MDTDHGGRATNPSSRPRLPPPLSSSSPSPLPHSSSSRPLRPLWFLRLVLPLLVLLLPCPARSTRFRVGVVGPWGCDPLYSKAMPGVAAQLAVDRINNDPALSWEDTFDYVLLQVRRTLWSPFVRKVTQSSREWMDGLDGKMEHEQQDG